MVQGYNFAGVPTCIYCFEVTTKSSHRWMMDVPTVLLQSSNGVPTASYTHTVSQVPYPAIPAANALTVSPLPSSNGGGLVPAVIQRRLTHWWSTALQAVVQPGGQAYHWKPVGPLLRQSQRWNQAHSNNPATPPSSHR
ncbi:hypothetical protein PCASD_13083 [Puccinia coronata f. sp. avenae]|uniref:Uncharacterized protein n=1 Tax=Puccinia coronata f. sp. avenae TaxID=200324 RepID=A0A2N5U8L1_9BASI|nr:hypothetical protein PCASD_13083 [Puccinia coronata f. sp. avenae]